MKVKNIQTFTPVELSNDDYHSEKYAEYASGSSLHLLFTECPAALKYGEHEETAALHFGTASHAAMLEPELFEKEFVKAVTKDDYAIKTDADIKAKLKSMGMSGYSAFKYPALLKMLTDNDDAVPFPLAADIQMSECKANGITLVKNTTIKAANGTERPGDYDMITQMRETLFANPANIELLKGAQVEMSVICEVEIDGTWHKVKIRPDIITSDCSVPDYKTTANMNPEKFGRQAHEAGYWFKQAFICDILKAVYDRDFKAGLLAQGKKAPHIYQLYWLTGDQLQIGREQYQAALRMFTHCNKSDVWPAYFDEPTELPTPGYVAKMYNI